MTDFYDRYTELIIRDPDSATTTTITSDELTVVFRTRVHDTGSSESYGAGEQDLTAEIGVFNLSDATIAGISHENTKTKTGGSTVTLISGYRGHHGVIFTGLVASISTEAYDADVLTIIGCRESNAIVKNAVVSMVWSVEGEDPEIPLSTIFTDIANEANIPIGRIDPCKTTTASRTYDQSQSVHAIFEEIKNECNVDENFRYEFDQGAVYFLDVENLERTVYDLTSSTGLLSAQFKRSPSYVNDSYDVTTVLLPELKWGGGVKIDNYVCSVTTKPIHVSNDDGHYTKFMATIGEKI